MRLIKTAILFGLLFILMIVMMSSSSGYASNYYDNSSCQYVPSHELKDELREHENYVFNSLINKELTNAVLGIYEVTGEKVIKKPIDRFNEITQVMKEQNISATPTAYIQSYKFGADYLIWLHTNKLQHSLKTSKEYYQTKMTISEETKDDYKFFQTILAVVSPNCSVGTDGLPVEAPIKIVSKNGPRELDGYHYGVDIGKKLGDNIYSIEDAKVISVSKECGEIGELGNKCGANGLVGGGNYVIYEIETSKGKDYISNLHMQKIYVQKGEMILKGQ
ncbi:MAG: lysozyme family protein, partial [Erysipelotrichaceae bacterium]